MMGVPREHYDVRKNSTTGVIENDYVKFHFSEWWNGEGMDCTFTKGADDSLSAEVTGREVHSFDMHELHVLMASALYMRLVDMEEVDGTVRLLEESVERKKRLMSKVRKDFKVYDRSSGTKEQEYD